MRGITKTITTVIISAFFASFPAMACTSMLVSAKASGTGRPMMWKHRDTGAEDNFIEKVSAADGLHAYVALFNGGDSLLAEAWTGMNDAGFAIMNTASYNLAPDTARYKDREGAVMKRALETCTSVSDFQTLLDTLPRPMGVQANFGVMDAVGGLAYFETYDVGYTRFDVTDSVGYIIRTNHSMTGNDTDGFGYIRYDNTIHILADEISRMEFFPWSFTEKASRSFWHSLLGKDCAEGTDRWVVDQDFIPRNISTASIVIEGVLPGSSPADMAMWTALGYPPCSETMLVTLDDVPDALRPTAPGWHSPYSNDVLQRKHMAFPIFRGNGQHYIDMQYLRPVIEEQRMKSYRNYKNHYGESFKINTSK